MRSDRGFAVRSAGLGLLMVLVTALAACSDSGTPADTGPASSVTTTTAAGAAGAGLELREVVESSLGPQGALADLPFTTGVIRPDDPYRDDPAFAESPPPTAGGLVTFGDVDGNSFFDPATETKFELAPPFVEAGQAASAQAVATPGTGWVVNVKLDDAGTQALAEHSAELVGHQVAIVVDRLVVAAPIIQAKITGGDVQIAGRFTEADAKRLAADLTQRG